MSSSSRPESAAAFAVWLTGLPASGKSTIAVTLRDQLAHNGIDAALLDSDDLRRVLTPEPTYTDAERDHFYAALTYIAGLLVFHGVPVIIAATANRRRYRDDARRSIGHFLEVYVDCPLELCAQRDPKGLYAGARKGKNGQLPGVGAEYEPPESPELSIHAEQDSPETAAGRIAAELSRRDWITLGP